MFMVSILNSDVHTLESGGTVPIRLHDVSHDLYMKREGEVPVALCWDTAEGRELREIEQIVRRDKFTEFRCVDDCDVNIRTFPTVRNLSKPEDAKEVMNWVDSLRMGIREWAEANPEGDLSAHTFTMIMMWGETTHAKDEHETSDRDAMHVAMDIADLYAEAMGRPLVQTPWGSPE